MIRVEKLSEEEWLITVETASTTAHQVRVSPADLIRFAGPWGLYRKTAGGEFSVPPGT
jgi:hypothetical protein